ncbi:MAG: hypothetical protein GWP08_11295 [Nitrospiraceae bacterium]|nr:hypothetical protein [Nitrospiraceae bacterium]
MRNMMLEDIEYVVEETGLGTWRRFIYENGQRFSEFTSHARVLGWPLIHVTYGRCPETGRRIVAKGVIAIGRLAVGGIAIGHASMGLVAIGQLGVGLLFGLAQAATGLLAVGQLAIGLKLALGQLGIGQVVIAQLGIGRFVLAQAGAGVNVWSMSRSDPAAVEFFSSILSWFTGG